MPVPSRELALGARLPWFRIQDIDGTVHSALDVAPEQIAIIAFICNHSPYVRHIEDRMAAVLNDFRRRGHYVLAVSPNDVVSYPSDDVGAMREQRDRGVVFEFPYCLDEGQDVAKAFGAACTPEFFVYDREGRLTYHGQFDGSRPSQSESIGVTGDSLVAAVDAIVTSEANGVDQPPSLGCSVKWRSGNEPDYILAIPSPDWILDLG